MYSVYLTNMENREIYRGDELSAAMIKAVGVGFECYIMEGDEVIMTYSPIGGWRNFEIKKFKESENMC